jgi:gliding motility-associated-like protein
LKHAVLIVILCASRLFSQLNPPDLRCLEVMNNGDVKLTWIPPSDPGNIFSTYMIHYSPVKNGPFTPIPTSITTLTTTSFIHTGSASTLQGCYYFMTTRSGPGGADSSSHSDTLRTIFVNTYTAIATQNIVFNHIHNPKLASSSDLYSVLKEYPTGTWNTLSATTGTVYPDTITTCRDTLRYRVILTDASGCSSQSNLQGGVYFDSKNPEEPYVDSISVLPNGNAVIGWEIPVDKDINQYEIQYKTPSQQNATISIVPGRNSTFYVYNTTTANSNTVGVFVKAYDSCGRGSTVNDQIMTMFLGTSYDNCRHRTFLTWNPYVWADVKGTPVETTLEYRIYYSVNGSPFMRVGTTTSTYFAHDSVDPGKNVCYFVRVINQRQTITASSNRSCFFSDQINAANYVYIKTASILSKTSALVKVYLDTSKASKGVMILRSEDDTTFSDIGFIPFSGNASYSFTDNNIKSDTKSYYYKAVLIDSCGNARGHSNVAKTILLKVHEDETEIFTKKLSWNAYQGFAGDVSGYNIYRIINDDMNVAPVGSTDALTTAYTDDVEDAAPDGARIEYMVQAVEGIGNPYGILEKSNSNAVPIYMEGNLYVPNAFAPQGINKTWLPITQFVDKSDYHVSIFNRWGKKVFETWDDAVGWDGENCISDVYVYLIDYKNSRGEYLQAKGTITLLR